MGYNKHFRVPSAANLDSANADLDFASFIVGDYDCRQRPHSEATDLQEKGSLKPPCGASEF
jgi:hypothetical protein